MSDGGCSCGACVGPRIIRGGPWSMLDGAGCVDPGIIRRGRRSVSDGAGCVCGGVAGAPSVDRLPKGDAPSSLELIVGPDRYAVDWYAPRSVTYSRRMGKQYRLPRRALPEVRDLCALPRNDPSREARNGKVLGGRRLLIDDHCFGDNTLGELNFSRKKKTEGRR